MKTQWDLSVLYESLNDSAIEKDQKKTDRAVMAFADKYRKNKRHLKDPKALALAIEEYESLFELPGSRASYYCSYRKELNTEDKAAEASSAKLDDRGTKRWNKLIYFTLEIGKLPNATQKRFLAAKELKEFRYWLKQIFDTAKYDLTEPEEKILALKSDVAHGRWVQATENIINKKTVAFEGATLPLPEAEAKIPTLPTPKRRALYKNVRSIYEGASDFAESEINAVYTDKKIEDELRKFKSPYEATILSYQNDQKSILSLVDAVAKNAKIAHRFYEIKRKLLKLDKLTYAERNAQIRSIKVKIPFEKAAQIVRDVFAELDSQYAEIFDRLLNNGQVDVFPKKGKSGGAFCSSGTTTPTYVLLNHIDNFESLKTLAHEMGHAVHAERTRTQRALYRDHPISTAETASTFFETAALNKIISVLPKEEQIVALHDKIQDSVSTVFRQIACFRFENALHALIRKEGYVPKEKIADLMNEYMSSYMGPAMRLEREDGYFFVHWSHIRRFFYVYTYAYGHLISSAMHRRLEKDPALIKRIDAFLAAGDSKSPYELFKACGLNTKDPSIFVEGLKSIEADVAKLERLTQ